MEPLEGRMLFSGPTAPVAPTPPAPVAQVVLPQMPTSDNWYGAIVNANHYVSPSYLTNLPPKLSLITDLSGDSAPVYSPVT